MSFISDHPWSAIFNVFVYSYHVKKPDVISAYKFRFINMNFSFIPLQCRQYHENKTAGDICNMVCTNLNQLKCMTGRKVKQVFELATNNQSILIKFHHKWFDILKKQQQNETLKWDTFISKRLNSNVPKYNWWRKFDNQIFHDSEKRNQFLALMSMEEPFRMSMYDGRDWSLKFLGVCGGIYGVEKMEYTGDKVFSGDERLVDMIGLTMPMFNYFDIEHFMYFFGSVLPQYWLEKVYELSVFLEKKLYPWLQQTKKPSFLERVVFGEQALIMVDKINRESNGNLQICDFHIGNLGFSIDRKVKLIDLDLLVTKNFLRKFLSNIKNCSHDAVCTFGALPENCVSHCNFVNSTCTKRIRYGNLQNLCKNVLLLLFDDVSQKVKPSVQSQVGLTQQTCKQLLANSCMSLEAEHKGVEEFLNLLQDLRSEYLATS